MRAREERGRTDSPATAGIRTGPGRAFVPAGFAVAFLVAAALVVLSVSPGPLHAGASGSPWGEPGQSLHVPLVGPVILGRPWVLALLPLAALPLLLRPRPLPVSEAPWSWSSEAWAGPAARGSWHAVPILVALATAALLGAASEPSIERAGTPGSTPGAAVMVALDVSASMREGPNPPLARARAALRSLSRTRADVRIGLVTFAGIALTRLPPSVDPALLDQALITASAGIPDQGTALGTALGIAAERLAHEEATARVVILLTDGRSNTGAVDPVTAARIARSQGVRVHAVELGDGEDEGAALLREVTREGGGRLLSDGGETEVLLASLEEVTPVPGVERAVVLEGAWPPLLLLAGALLGAARLLRLLVPAPEGW